MSTSAPASRARVDADQVRTAHTGEATRIAGGRAERVRIIKTNIAPAVREVAWELVAGPPGLALRAPSVGTPHIPPRYRPGRSQAGSYLALTSRLKVLRPSGAAFGRP